MQFLLNDIPVQSPHVLLSTCEVNGIDTSLWLGKANSFVDVRGIDPSYGYFLVDYSIIELATTFTGRVDGPAPGQEDTGITPTGSYKLQLTIVTDQLVNPSNPNLGYNTRTISDLFVKSYINVTPSLSGEESTYLLHLVDARYVFSSQESSNFSRYTNSSHQWFNKVEAYLTPDEAQYEYNLVEPPEYGVFIYDETTVEDLAFDEIGETEDGTTIRVPKPRTWDEILYETLKLFCGSPPIGSSNEDPTFPYFANPEQPLVLTIPTAVKNNLPKYIPQDLCTKYTSGRDFIYKLLYWTNTSLIYHGYGEFELIPIEVKEKPIPGSVSKWTEFEELMDTYGNPSDLKYQSIGQDSECVPQWLSHQYPKIEQERFNNEIDEYYQYNFYIEDESTNPLGRRILKTGSNCFQVTIPLVFVTDRLPISLSVAKLPQQELINDSHTGLFYWFRYQTERLFGQYPKKIRDFTGFLDIRPNSFVERVTLRDLGDGPYTLVENIKDIEWNLFAPTPIIPREQKFGVILAKCKEEVLADSLTFEFYDPKVLLGEFPKDFLGYNTRRQHYDKDEEIILVHGQSELWRVKSLLVDPESGADFWFTIDADPCLTLKVPIANLVEEGTGSNRYKCGFSNSEIVNGQMPKEDDEDETEGQFLSILNQPACKWDDADEFIYIVYDETVGDKPRNKWTFGDAYNDIYFLKGLPGYVKNPVEPSPGEETERRLVLKSPFSDGQSIGWLEEAADGRTDEELEQFIITIIQEQGGGGGEGGNTTMMKGFVNKSGGVAGTEATFNFQNATVLVSDGTAQPNNGACDNTFNTPFVHNEPILLLKKNNGVWTAIKIQHNIIAGTPTATVKRNATTFSISGITVIEGTAPDTAIGVGDNEAYMLGEPLLFSQTNDNKWRVIHRAEITGLFRTIQPIGQASYNETSGVLIVGTGQARRFVESNTNDSQFSVETPPVVIKNMTNSSIPTNKNIQAKKIGRYWFVDVENCA